MCAWRGRVKSEGVRRFRHMAGFSAMACRVSGPGHTSAACQAAQGGLIGQDWWMIGIIRPSGGLSVLVEGIIR